MEFLIIVTEVTTGNVWTWFQSFPAWPGVPEMQMCIRNTEALEHFLNEATRGGLKFTAKCVIPGPKA